MTDDLLSIGELARAGGLSASALRYYDAAGVLRPAHVDPATGYRWYTAAQQHTARLLASLRQAGMPVADLVAVLAAPHEAAGLLDRHRRRLEDDLAAAGAHLDAASDLLAEPGRGVVDRAELLAAVAAVRHAVGADAAWPALAGVLLHLDVAALRVVGCDRFRLALATVPVRRTAGPAVRAVATLEHLDRIAAAPLPPAGTIVLGARSIELLGVPGEPLAGGYPDYERVLRTGATRADVATTRLVDAADRAAELVVLRLDRDDVRVGVPGPGDAHAFSRSFLLDAVRAARAERVTLTLDDDGSALGVSPAGREDHVGLVMPVRLRA